ncbi:MAG: MoxR family ATPase [Planctomycetota bacterium]|nr:MAG: MoxR family ATPase [Planctomycetota bacterium]
MIKKEEPFFQPLPAEGFLGAGVHYFDQDSILAINAAIAARRPLLLRGEPGTGKSQMARAAAEALGWKFRLHAVHANTEPQDLLWKVDAVARLGKAQLLGHSGTTFVEADLEEHNFIVPGLLWWGFHWDSAQAQQDQAQGAAALTKSPTSQVVLLLDEIDKADSSIPNALLDSLGRGAFEVPGIGKIACQPEMAPLVIFSTNEERPLPDAFLRRCLVHHIDIPKDEIEFQNWLLQRGEPHFSGNHDTAKVEKAVLERAAEIVSHDRQLIQKGAFNPPGLAEFLDLIRAVSGVVEKEIGSKASQKVRSQKQLEYLNKLAKFALVKHPDLSQSSDFLRRMQGESHPEPKD